MTAKFVQCLEILWSIDFWAQFGTTRFFRFLLGANMSPKGTKFWSKKFWSTVFQYMKFWYTHWDCSDGAETLRFCSTIEYLKIVDYELEHFIVSTQIMGFIFSDCWSWDFRVGLQHIASCILKFQHWWQLERKCCFRARGFVTLLHSTKSHLYWCDPNLLKCSLVGAGDHFPVIH